MILGMVCAAAAAGAEAEERRHPIDASLVDETGRAVRFHDDLVKGRVVAINFIFTRCQAICPPMSGAFAKAETLLGERQARLISVSLDPATDTPERLAGWKKRFGGGASWTLLTGSKEEIDRLGKALGAFEPDRSAHSPTVIVLDDASGRMVRVNGLGGAQAIVKAMDDVATPAQAQAQAPAAQAGAARYFQGLALVDQDGRAVDLYQDEMKDRVVVINSFFTSCQGICPLTTGTLAYLQKRFEENRELQLISISADPARDTPAKLKAYAAKLGAKDRWAFLTGSRAQVDAALSKLGQYAERPDAHGNLIIVGNLRTGLWKKALGLAKREEIGDVVQSVLEDE
jgi:cytochrome oxidase Cu insertion factor (SCO1/SenC/PrrC family)